MKVRLGWLLAFMALIGLSLQQCGDAQYEDPADATNCLACELPCGNCTDATTCTDCFSPDMIFATPSKNLFFILVV